MGNITCNSPRYGDILRRSNSKYNYEYGIYTDDEVIYFWKSTTTPVCALIKVSLSAFCEKYDIHVISTPDDMRDFVVGQACIYYNKQKQFRSGLEYVNHCRRRNERKYPILGGFILCGLALGIYCLV